MQFTVLENVTLVMKTNEKNKFSSSISDVYGLVRRDAGTFLLSDTLMHNALTR